MKVVVTVVGVDRVGIIARVATVLAENYVNIVSINQTILDGMFNMIINTITKGVAVNGRAPQQTDAHSNRTNIQLIVMNHLVGFEDIFNT